MPEVTVEDLERFNRELAELAKEAADLAVEAAAKLAYMEDFRDDVQALSGGVRDLRVTLSDYLTKPEGADLAEVIAVEVNRQRAVREGKRRHRVWAFAAVVALFMAGILLRQQEIIGDVRKEGRERAAAVAAEAQARAVALAREAQARDILECELVRENRSVLREIVTDVFRVAPLPANADEATRAAYAERVRRAEETRDRQLARLSLPDCGALPRP